MSIDTVGGFAGNRSSKRYMHILVDHFTRYAWIHTSKNQTAMEFVKLIEPVSRHNKIQILLADQYTGINSNDLKKFLRDKEIKLIFTSTDCADSNGLNERLNQTLTNRIRCKMNDRDPRAWSKIADDCVTEYNRTEHSVTKFEPAYLLFGTKSSINPLERDNSQPNLERDREQAYNNSMKNFESNKKRIDKNRREFDFKVGDLVYIENGSKMNRKKLDRIRIGPFPISKRISSLIYEVQCGKRRRESNYFHVKKLFPFSSPEKVT